MTDRPEPMTPPDCDLRGHDWMRLSCDRLFHSSWYFAALKDGRGGLASLKLWWVAMLQIPAGSLPNDEEELCFLADFGQDMKAWRKHRVTAMYGFKLCSDNRWYHPVIAEEVVRAYNCKLKARQDRQADNERLRRWRAGKQNGQAPPETPDETRFNSRFETPDETHSETRKTVQDSTKKGREVSKIYNNLTSSKSRESAREATAPIATTEEKNEPLDPEKSPAFITPELLQMHLNRLAQKLKPPHTPTHARSPDQQIAILNAPAHVSEELPPPINEMQSEVVEAPRQPLRPLNPIRSPAQQIAEILGISEDSAAAFLTAKATPHTALQAAA